MTPFTLTLHDPMKLSLDARLEVARFDAAQFAYANPDEPPLVVEAMATGMGLEIDDERCLLLLARKDGLLVGRGRLTYDLVQNTDKGHLHVTVRPQERRQGLGTTLVARLAQEALNLSRTMYSTATSSRSPDGETFAASLGARASLPMVISELMLGALDHAQLQAWVTRPANDPYRLHRFTLVPDHELGRVAAVFGVMNTAPRGDLEYDDWVISPDMVASWQQAQLTTGWQRLLYTVEHLPTAEFVAFSEVGWHPQRAALIDQQGTAVRADHRGHGLGKWVKAAILLDLPGHNPEGRKIYTGNANENAAMLGINRALGYAPAFNRMEWQGQTAELLQASQRVGAEATH